MSEHKEVESKILEVDFKDISKKIVSIGWVLEFYKQKFTAVWMENSIWDKFRIRQEWQKVNIEHKELSPGKDGVKEAVETLMRAIDFAEAKAFFPKIWFQEVSFSVKDRTSYILDLEQIWEWKVNIVIDEYSDLDGLVIPAFIEIEALNRDIIVKVAKLLWYTELDLKDWGAGSLKKYYKDK